MALTQERIDEIIKKHNLKPLNAPTTGSGVLQSKNYSSPEEFLASINTPTQQPQGEQKSLLRRAGEFIPNVAVGAVKGLGSTLAGASELGEKYLLNPIDRAMGNNVSEQSSVEQLGIKEKLKPTNTAQKIGFGAEQIAEFFAPGGIIGKAGKAVEGASKLQKAGALAAKVVGEGVGAGGVTSLQSGKIDKNSGTNAAISASIPVVGKVVDVAAAPLKKFLSENIAPRIVNSILKPASKEFNFGRNAGAGVVEEGIVGKTRQDLLNNISSKKTEIGNEMDKILNLPENTAKIIDVSKAISPIDEAMQKAVKNGEQGLYDRLKSVKDGMTKEFELVEDKLTAVGNKNLTLSPSEAKKIKTELGQATKWTGQAFDNDVNQVRVKIYQNIDKMLDEAVPGIDKLNSRYANILSAEKSLDRAIDTAQKQNLVGLKDLGVGAAYGTVQSISQGQISPQDFILGILGNKVAGSTVAKTNVANLLGKLRPEQKTALSKAVPILRNIIFGLQDKDSAK